MQNSNDNFGIFSKEWRARRLTIGALYGISLLMLAYLLGQECDVINPLAFFTPVAILILAIGIFSHEERDPARAFLYQLPISRLRLLTIKLLALMSQVLPLLIIFGIAVALWCARNDHPDDTPFSIKFHMFRRVWFVCSIFSGGIALSFLAAIVSLHLRSVIMAFILSAAIASGVGSLTLFQSNDLDAMLMNAPIHLTITALLLLGWLFILFCRTRIQELSPTPRALLTLLFGLVLLEVVFTIVYTGWSDLGYLIFGI